MFGTMGFSELIIILVIILIIFGAGRLPQLGEGLGKALKGFKKEVNEAAAPPVDPNAEGRPPDPGATAAVQPETGTSSGSPQPSPAASQPTSPYTPGPELTPGTTAAIAAAGAGPEPPRQAPPRPQPQPAKQPAAGASATPSAQPGQSVPGQTAQLPKPPLKRPSAIVNKAAVARVQAQQAALRSKAQTGTGPNPQDMQSLGEGLGDALRTFRQAVSDVRNTVDPEMRTIQAEMDAAQKEIEQSIESAKQMPSLDEEPPKPS